jgi:NAD(P)-dependent dehydrogenase (short-subunit alcohol dehydrogenase family)
MSDRDNIIVTGGSGGIGEAIVHGDVARGVGVSFTYLNDQKSALELVSELSAAGHRVIAVPCNVTDESSVEALFKTAELELGPIASLVNNAGVTGPIGRFQDASFHTLRNVVDVNLIGTMLCALHAIKSWRRTGAKGAIVNVSSIAARLGAPGEYVHYAAAKAGVEAFTVGLGKELGAEGIRVNAVCPGTILTNIHVKAGEPQRAQRVAQSVPMKRARANRERLQRPFYGCFHPMPLISQAPCSA